MDNLAAAAAAMGVTVDELVAFKRARDLASLSPAERATAESAQRVAVARLESVPDGAEARIAARRSRPRSVSTTPPVCNRCGRTNAQREIRYPVGWHTDPQPFGEELSEDEIPICCGRSIEMGSPEDRAYREIECLRWGRQHGWVPLPEAPPDLRCKFCRRDRGTDEGMCQRGVETGSAEDKAMRAMECSTVAAEIE